jgi:hypothetical protein
MDDNAGHLIAIVCEADNKALSEASSIAAAHAVNIGAMELATTQSAFLVRQAFCVRHDWNANCRASNAPLTR